MSFCPQQDIRNWVTGLSRSQSVNNLSAKASVIYLDAKSQKQQKMDRLLKNAPLIRL